MTPLVTSLPTNILISCILYAEHPEAFAICKLFATLYKTGEVRAFFLPRYRYLIETGKFTLSLLNQTALRFMIADIGPISYYHAIPVFKSWNLLLFLRGLIPSNSSAALLFCTEVRKFDIYAHATPIIRRQVMESSGTKIIHWLEQRKKELTLIQKVKLNKDLLLMLPSRIRYLTGLQDLRVSSGLIQLNNIVGMLTCLRKLILRQNQLKELPNTLVHLQRLSVLDLDHNAFEIIPSVVYRLRNLNIFSIAHNQIRSIQKEVAHLQRMECIDFSYNGCSILPTALFSCRSLRVIIAQFNWIYVYPKLPKSAKIEIDLRGNPWSTYGSNRLPTLPE